MDTLVRGTAAPLDSAGLDAALDVVQTKAPELWAVLQVETSGFGFLPATRRPGILFERHVFHARTHGDFDASHPAISAPTPGGYGPGGENQYARLDEASALDRTAALESASWGIGQVMGYHATELGFADVSAMVDQMTASEANQLLAMARFIARSGLAGALRAHDWARFARGYNGDDFAINHYDTRLASACDAMARGGLPDLAVRAGQAWLTYLSLDPRGNPVYDTHGIDGVMGRMTRSAMNAFQAANQLAPTQFFDEPTLTALRAAVS